jgi:hypothetical protein
MNVKQTFIVSAITFVIGLCAGSIVYSCQGAQSAVAQSATLSPEQHHACACLADVPVAAIAAAL